MDDLQDLELKHLEREAAKIDAALNNETAELQQAEKEPSLNGIYKPAIINVLGKGAGLGNSIAPFTTQVFSDQAREDIADSIINVADVERIDLKTIFGDENSRIGAWIGLAISLGAPSFMWYMAFKEYRKSSQQLEKQAAAADKKQQGPAADDTGALMPAMQIG